MRWTGKTALAIITLPLATGLLLDLGPARRFVQVSLEQALYAGAGMMRGAGGDISRPSTGRERRLGSYGINPR
jgi:hypothetical protein